MYKEVLENLTHSSGIKFSMYKNSKRKYTVSSAMAGFYIGIGILIMGLSIAIFGRYGTGVDSLVNGFVFTLALSLVMMAGGDLFTGNILVHSQGALNKKITALDAVSVCTYSWFGNFIGALLLSLLFFATGIKDLPIGEALAHLAVKKGSYAPQVIFFKGILCNVLVCLAVLCCYKLKSESAKLIMIFWCILPFISLGFEHSVANMTVFSLGLMLSKEVTFSMAATNLIFATLGNIAGGLLVSFSYFIIGKE
ncbi:formate/nitrite transporter family protein [Treponema phagedenis]|uniref:Formate/nitrite transporter family protein n=1 Tax=Treponema phagedenis TaxID=162 RepID=A0AAE6IRE7_TREPH|nr:formate/nitrite transporter family protein [Treponema phagedenis]NVP25453.1 formate/nitrite transporter family protein [Treponema phagedenis]QEJ96745.1 formate/nitrite transporter family protein [Treponema phagedenis]QEJ96816.1 formate/nitrite transporter family protein [Treponema phagedenis]QEJ96905.1 formate/nitrite transporter family protein [Treponema phagedenis]QEK02059.1 formate/nitrite transporter family protein [Treponema phagedenis]